MLCCLETMDDDDFGAQYLTKSPWELYGFEDDEDQPDSFPLTHAKLQHYQEKDKSLHKDWVNSKLHSKEKFTAAGRQYELIVRNGKILSSRRNYSRELLTGVIRF